MLNPTDCIKDRLAHFYHWDDIQALEQAINVYNEMQEKIDILEIKRWSKKEQHTHKCDIFLDRL